MGNVTLIDRDGHATDVSEEQAPELLRSGGYSVEGGEARANRVGESQRESDSSAVEATLQGVARGASFGGTDVLQRALGGEDARRHLESLQKYHGNLSLVGELGGGLLAGGAVGKLGELAGGGILGGVVEGSAYGAGTGVSELALSDQPITAERIAQTMGSNVLLGGVTGGAIAGAGKLVEKGLMRASDSLAESAAARSAIEGVPQDLASLDERGLGEAAKTAKAEHAGDIGAERQSLEQLRVSQRAEVANQVKDLHIDLASERPIYRAITEADQSSLNPALKEIDGISDAHVQLAKSYKSMRSQFDNMLSIESNPEQLIKPLQQRQGALETLQEKLPEMHAALAGDARADALAHIPEALAETKQQIAAIQALNSRANPVTSGRLSMLEGGPSARMQAIDAAKTALANGPELGIVGKSAKAAAFGGATALAHAIPGVGIAAPFIGAKAGELVGSLFKRMAGAHAEIAGKTASSVQRFLGTAAKGAEIAPRAAALTATETLRNVRFGPKQGDAEEPTSLPDLYKARSLELRQQTEYAPDGSVQMRPDARLELAKKLNPVRAVNPILADQIETVAARRTTFLSGKLPRQPQVGNMQIGPDTWRPSDLAIRSFARSVLGAEHPDLVEERLADGIVTPQEAEAYRAVYPERFADLQQTIIRLAPQLSKTLPSNKKVALAVFTGIPTMPALQPNVLKQLQANFAVEPGSAGGQQAPTAQPNYGAMGSLKDTDKPTPAQERQQ